MHNKRNVIVMFLLIMLSFAIITEVSAAGDAEINGTGSNPSMMSDDMTVHDISSERDDEIHADDFRSHNDQNSFDKTPMNVGDNKSNENLYEHEMDEPMLSPHDLNRFDEFRSDDMRPLDNMSGDARALDFNDSSKNISEFMFNDRPMGDLKNLTPDSRNNSFNDAFKKGELMEDAVSKLIGLNNIAPNVNDKNISPNDSKPLGDNNGSAPLIPGDKNSSDIGSDNIAKNKKTLKAEKKSGKKSKIVKKSPKKVKSNKKPKKANRKLPKKSAKERAKL